MRLRTIPIFCLAFTLFHFHFIIYVLLILCKFHIMHSILFIFLFPHPYPSSGLATSLLPKVNKTNPRNLTVEATVCHTVYPFAQTTSLTNAHCSKILVWFQVSGLCSTVNTESSLGFFLDILMFPWVLEILQLWFWRSRLFPSSSSSFMG